MTEENNNTRGNIIVTFGYLRKQLARLIMNKEIKGNNQEVEERITQEKDQLKFNLG